MAFLVSPGVKAYEIDASNTVPGVSTSTGAYASAFKWGPVEDITSVSSETELVTKFGSPDLTTNASFAVAANFLMYGNSLRVVRATSTGQLNADDATGVQGNILIKNSDHYDGLTAFPTGSTWAARYPGDLGNSITVSVCPADATAFGTWSYRGNFDAAPGTSTFAENHNITLDELHIVVVDSEGAITGTAGTVLERFSHISQLSDAKQYNGENNYYKDVVNNRSAWIHWTGHDADLTDSGSASAAVTGAMDVEDAAITTTFTGGADGATPTDGELLTAYNLFANKEAVSVDLIIGGAVSTTLGNNLIAIVEDRKDAIVCLSPELADSLSSTPGSDVLAWGNALNKSTYAVLDSTALKVYDKYNDVYVNIPAAGAIAGTMAATDDVADPWFSPAGVARGQIRGVTKLLWNPTQTERDALYKASINPVVSMPGQGTMLFGDKTNAGKPSAFDRINVRRLFITLERAIAVAARSQLFEFNDDFTRAQFRNMVEPFLRDVKGRRGITDFKVVCDTSNNTGNVIDTNQFVADIYIKPSRSINFITLNFIVTRTGVEFSEIAG